jgi:uncharacterized membrane protein
LTWVEAETSFAAVTNLSLRDISVAGLIAAVYAVLALALAPISFGVYQVRVSEALTVLPFLAPAAIPGLFFGAMIANVFGGVGWMDIVFGSLLTLVAAFATRGIYHLSRTCLSTILALVAPLLLWVGAFAALTISSGQLVAILPAALSVVCLIWLERLRSRGRASQPVIITFLVGSFVLLLLAISVFREDPDISLLIIGAAAMLGGWLITWVLLYVWMRGKNPNMVIAPLPPVIINAFGVAAYLAPIQGFDYWFAVQMIGLGQLISCYVLGLPLLLVLEKKKGLVG